MKYKVREDLSLFQTGEFESIFVEFFSDDKSIIVGEIYRVPNTDEKNSPQRYEAVIDKIIKLNNDTIIGTDQKFDYLMLESHTTTSALLDTFISHGLAPCITRPTRVTHNTAHVLIIYILVQTIVTTVPLELYICDISDHFPVFTCVGSSKDTVINGPLSLKHRTLGKSVYNQLVFCWTKSYSSSYFKKH